MTTKATVEDRIRESFEHFTFDTPLATITANSPARRRRFGGSIPRLVALGGTALVAALLVARNLMMPTSAFASWTAVPSLADPVVATAAQSYCLDSGSKGASLIVQDQRGLAAALLYASPPNVISCMVALDADGKVLAASASGTHIGKPATGFGLDSVSRAGGGNDAVTRVFGHQSAAAHAVTLMLSDGQEVHASVSQGYFLAWWPSVATITSLQAADANGSKLAELTRPEDAIPSQ
jgi:hypothetical protein